MGFRGLPNVPSVPRQQQKAMRDAILTQVFGCLGTLALQNGLVLLYLTARGLSSARILVFLSIPTLTSFLLTTPAAYLADRVGKK